MTRSEWSKGRSEHTCGRGRHAGCRLRLALILAVLVGATLGFAEPESRISVDFGKKIRVVPPFLFGQNLQTIESGEQVIAKDGSLDGEIVRILTEARITSLRFPGGTQADHFIWWQAVGPPSRRALQASGNKVELYRPVVGPEEYIELAEALRAVPFITANTGSGNPELAAAWAAYFKSVGFPVEFWEIGNEPYFLGIDDSGKLGLTPDAYAERLIQYAGAIRAEVPNAKIFAAGLTGPNYEESYWNSVLLGIAGPYVDGLSIHNGYAPLFAYTPGENPTVPSDDYVYTAMMGATYVLEESLNYVAEQLTRRGRLIPIFLTEYDGIFYPEETVEDVEVTLARNPTLASALYNASVFQIMMRNTRVHGAHHMSLAGSNYGSLVGVDGDVRYRNPQFYVHQEYAKEADNIVVETTLEPMNAIFDSGPVREIPGQSDVSILDAVATVSPRGDRYALFVVNRSLTEDVETQVETNLPSNLSCTATLLNGPSHDSRNDAQDPLRVSPEVAPADHESRFMRRFPAHSLTILRWVAGEGQTSMIANGLAPPNPANVIDHSDYLPQPIPGQHWFVLVRNAGYCDSSPCDCGQPTEVSLEEGGEVDSLEAHDASRLMMTGGAANELEGFNCSAVSVSGGSVRELKAHDTSTITVEGGTVEQQLWADDSSTVVLCGGTVSGAVIVTHDSSTIRIVGSGFKIDGEDAAYGDLTGQTGVLTGTLASGDPVANLSYQRYGGTITLSSEDAECVPEPTTVLLHACALATLGLLRRRLLRRPRTPGP